MGRRFGDPKRISLTAFLGDRGTMMHCFCQQSRFFYFQTFQPIEVVYAV